jgi:hypothetical protein
MSAKQPLRHQSLDDFRAGHPKRFWQADDGSLVRAIGSRIPGRAPLDRAEAGVGLVAESVITPTRRAMYLELFDGCSVMFVAVRCALPVAQAREEARSDRSHGALNLDAPDFETVHQHIYDVEVNTFAMDPEEAAQQVLEAFRARRRRKAFETMRDGDW